MRAVSLLLLVACGDNLAAPPTGDTTSGSRLKLHWYEYDSGTRQLASATTMFDAERGEDCTLQRWSDGRTYCTPAASIASYLDPACTVEVGRSTPAGQAVPKYLQHVFFLNGDPLPSRLYEMGEPVGDVAALYELIGDDCVAAPFDADGEFVALGPEVLKDDLVAVARHELPTDGPIALEVDTSHDGMVVQVGGVDRMLGECTVAERPGAPQTICVPAIEQFSSDFLDEGCTEPAFAASSGVALPDLVEVSAPLGDIDLRPLGELTTHRSVFDRTGATCTEVPVADTTRVFRLGERIELPQLDRTRGPGDRIHPISDGGIALVDPLFYDSELDVDCRGQPLGGDIRCVPVMVPVEVRFTDPACTSPVDLAVLPPGVAPRSVYAQGPGQARIFPVLAPSPTVYEVTTGDRCAEALIPDGMVFYTLGEPTTAAIFAASTQVTE